MSDVGQSERIRRAAIGHGFETVGFSPATLPMETGERLSEFLSLNRHGDMRWLEDRANKRSAPAKLWPEARSAIMLGVNYGPDHDPMRALEDRSHGVISVYAQNKDYHDVVKKNLKKLAHWLVAHEGGDVKVFVDTAPVMEKPLSAQAGLGWQGKHTNLVSREYGSWLFLSAIYTTLELTYDKPETDHCGSCRNCLNICPTDAFPAPFQLDARRCISYLTIEHKGAIPIEFRKAIGNRIYGCDDCLAVCPWNKFASTARDSAYHARKDLAGQTLAELSALDDKAFRAFFTKSPVKRTGRVRFIRNVLIAMGNSKDRGLLPAVRTLLDDESPIVRGAAVWALGQLSDATEFRELSVRHAKIETDPGVILEWRQSDQASTVT